MLEEVSRLLARIGSSGSFAARRTAATEDLNLEVQGIGRIRFPITPAIARKLCEVARPARYGLKDQTRLDRRVRDTWEIPKGRITIDDRRWNKTLTPQLDRVRRDLGLPDGCRLKAQLHNLLVYGPGHFFTTHQDSEKADDMIGTLVVSLPSKFTGGVMSIEHHGEKKLMGGSERSLTFIAFYADCHHEVRPIKQGYRVVLTYNLIVEGDGTTAGAPTARIEALTRRIRDFFDTPRPPRRYSNHAPGPPDRLVYLLDHEYTQRGLAWNRLKNSDATRAGALREVAAQLDCEIFLALADVHETWSCEEEDYGPRRYRWGRDYHDEEDDDGEYGEDTEPDDRSSGTPELTELLDSDIELRHWIGSGKRPRAMGAGVDADELCYTKPSVELEPFESEHEGYMGNEGNTVDRWYHRAAVVLWPRERTFVIRAKASPRWGISQVGKQLKARAGTAAGEALRLAQRLLPFWAEVAGRDAGRALIDETLVVAAKLGDAKIAAALLAPFTLTGVSAKATPRLADLLDRYGEQWCRTLLRQWASESKVYRAPEIQTTWISSALPGLCRSLCARDSSDGQTLARGIVTDQWAWVLDQFKDIRKHESVKEMTKELGRLSKPIFALIDSSRIANHADLHKQMIDFLIADTTNKSLTRLRLGLLRAAHARYRSDRLRSLGLKPLHTCCSDALTTRLNAPPRAKDDWSITTSVRCSCKLCATLTRYLRASDRVRFEWPLAQTQRAHIHDIVDSRELPVRHTTRRTGRPFTLMLEKTAAVFECDAADRRSSQHDLQWLKRTSADF